jgi:nitrogen fixation NifU-like protein
MQRQEFIENLLEHYEAPRFHGPLPEADIIVSAENPGCGDVVTIYLNVGKDNTATRIQFESEGCTISQASTSILVEMMQGKPLADIQALDYNALIETLGKSVILTRVSCATLGLKTLKKAIQQYKTQQAQP